MSKKIVAPSFFEAMGVIIPDTEIADKGGLSYLSAATAQRLAGRPEVRFVEFNGQPMLPLFKGSLVAVEVQLPNIEEEVWQRMYLPVMDQDNRALELAKTKATDINNARQRCLVKALATVYGHGMSVFLNCGGDGAKAIKALGVTPETDLADVQAIVALLKEGEKPYVEWVHSLAAARITDPTFHWEVVLWDGKPYREVLGSVVVDVDTVYRGKRQRLSLPLMDGLFEPIPASSATTLDWNKSMMRVLTKGNAFNSGYGLRVYAGDDLGFGADAKGKGAKPAKGSKADKAAAPAAAPAPAAAAPAVAEAAAPAVAADVTAKATDAAPAAEATPPSTPAVVDAAATSSEAVATDATASATPAAETTAAAETPVQAADTATASAETVAAATAETPAAAEATAQAAATATESVQASAETTPAAAPAPAAAAPAVAEADAATRFRELIKSRFHKEVDGKKAEIRGLIPLYAALSSSTKYSAEDKPMCFGMLTAGIASMAKDGMDFDRQALFAEIQKYGAMAFVPEDTREMVQAALVRIALQYGVSHDDDTVLGQMPKLLIDAGVAKDTDDVIRLAKLRQVPAETIELLEAILAGVTA